MRVGVVITPSANFTELSYPDTYMAKAFDDRVGCSMEVANLENLSKLDHPNDVFAVATVQEEVGLRGAVTNVEVVDPDASFILEIDAAGDTPNIKPEESDVKMGAGPSLLI